jgi:hypothetical protein
MGVAILAINNHQTREILENDLWHACDILRRDNNCGGVMEYVEHLAWLLFLRFLDAQEKVWEAENAGRKKPWQTGARPSKASCASTGCWVSHPLPCGQTPDGFLFYGNGRQPLLWIVPYSPHISMPYFHSVLPSTISNNPVG